MTTTSEPRTDPDASGPGRGRRRTAVVVGAAVLVAAAIATPSLLSAGDDAAPARAAGDGRTPSPAPVVASGSLTGDVDGDGQADVVTLSHRDLLRVRLGSGRSVARLLQGHPRLEGLADVGGSGLVVVTSRTSEDFGHARDWTVWAVRGRDLAPLRIRHRIMIGTEPGSSVAWIDGGRLFSGVLDSLQSGSDHVAVLARSWSLDNGSLAGSRAGVRCWDRTSQRPPATCAQGQDWRYDVGPHGDLPALLPTVQPAWASADHVSFGAEHWRVRRATSSGDPETAAYDLVHTRDGTVRTVRVPHGWAPTLFASPVRLGAGTTGVVLSQEGGDSDTWRVYVDHRGRVQQLATRGPVDVGGGFTADGGTAYLSWLTPDGGLYTRIGTEQLGRYRVYAWRPTVGNATTAPALQAVDLGPVCIDEMWQTYGTCASPG